MMMLWSDKEHGVFDFAYTYDLQPVIDYMQDQEVTHCYASFWIAYRITFATNEDIICAQPYNERFHGWPLLFKDVVDKVKDTPVIMMESDRSELSAYRYKEHLFSSYIYSDECQIGPYLLFENFKHKKYKNSKKLTVLSDSFRVSVSNEKKVLLELSDHDPSTRWISDSNQKKGMGLTVSLDEAYPVEVVDLT